MTVLRITLVPCTGRLLSGKELGDIVKAALNAREAPHDEHHLRRLIRDVKGDESDDMPECSGREMREMRNGWRDEMREVLSDR